MDSANISYTPAPIPTDEEARLKSLQGLKLLDTLPEERFDRITRIATVLFDVPISTVTLVDSRREWFKSCQGLPVREGERAISFCGHAVLDDDPLIIPDAKDDPRFAQNPMVIDKPFIRFYAGIPLKSADGRRVGAFCIKDHNPREFPSEKVKLLKALSAWAELELNAFELSIALEARRTAEAKIIDLNGMLKVLNKILRHDILNDLTVVNGNIALYLQYGKEKVDVNETMKAATEAIKRDIAFIGEMKELEGAISEGKELQQVNVQETAQKVAEQFKDMKIDIQGEADVLADNALESVITNLVRNAKVHALVNQIYISITIKDKNVIISVADTGKGIPDEIKPKLFVEGGKFGETGHTGLGLYIIKKTIDRYGGRVWVENNQPRGSIFVIELPQVRRSTSSQ
jgi:signal transduction histidine kinase